MKTKSSLYFRMTLPILFLLSCTNHQTTEPAPSAGILQTTILADLLNKFIDDNLSMQNVASLARTAYGIDFDREYEKILPRLLTNHTLRVEARGQDLAVGDMALILQNNGITSGTPIYRHMESVVNLFEREQPNTYVIGEFSRLKDDALTDYRMSQREREGLASIFIFLANNYDGIVSGIEAAVLPASNERSQGLFSVVWRVVRSVVITAAVGALMGIPGGYPGVAIGATVAGSAAIADYRSNNYCHFALQCDGGWRQDCMTGECMPYVQ